MPYANKEFRQAYDRARSKESNRRRYEKDPAKEKARTSAYQKEHPEVTRRSMLKRQYGLTLEAYASMLEGQDGLCAICQCAPEDGKNLYVDHDHNTGNVRGLLCICCNRALGLLHDDSEVVESLLEYLRKSV